MEIWVYDKQSTGLSEHSPVKCGSRNSRPLAAWALAIIKAHINCWLIMCQETSGNVKTLPPLDVDVNTC